MLALVLDTNAIHRDPWLTRETGKKLLSLADAGACVIVYPQVVIDELYRQRFEAARRAHDLAADGLEEMAKAGVDVAQTAADLASNLQRIGSDLESAFAKVIGRDNVVVAPVPKVEAAELVKRDLERRRPFMEIESGQKKKSVGFRDVLIWETVLEMLRRDPAYALTLFVSSDNGFLDDDSKGLHPDLHDDLDKRGIERERVSTVKSIPHAISEVEDAVTRFAREAVAREAEDEAARAGEDVTAGKAEPTPVEPEAEGAEEREDAAGSTGATPAEPTASTEEEEEEAPGEDTVAGIPRGDLVTAATDALYGLANKDVSMQMVYGGDYDYPDFVKFTMPNTESGFLSYIDQTTEFTFRASPTSPDILVATADAVISIEGAVFKGAWFVDDSNSVGIMGELNDHYFETSSEVDVRVVVEIDIEGGRLEVIDVVLEDPPTQTDGPVDVLEFELPEGMSIGVASGERDE